jgi:hypothetical protein
MSSRDVENADGVDSDRISHPQAAFTFLNLQLAMKTLRDMITDCLGEWSFGLEFQRVHIQRDVLVRDV